MICRCMAPDSIVFLRFSNPAREPGGSFLPLDLNRDPKKITVFFVPVLLIFRPS